MNEKPTSFELYSVFVETISAAEQRRQQVLNMYYSILVAVSALLSADIKINFSLLVIVVTIISFIFFAKIRYFKQLATAKFKVINQLESTWDIKPFSLEWAEFKGSQKLKFNGILTFLESTIPLFIGITGVIYLIATANENFLSKFCQ